MYIGRLCICFWYPIQFDSYKSSVKFTLKCSISIAMYSVIHLYTHLYTHKEHYVLDVLDKLNNLDIIYLLLTSILFMSINTYTYITLKMFILCEYFSSTSLLLYYIYFSILFGSLCFSVRIIAP